MNFLKTSLNAVRTYRGEKELDAMDFLKFVREQTKALNITEDMLKRAVNVGFSGGEKKRNEIFQMAMLEPRLSVLDETDSGLDIDALRTVADGVNMMRSTDRAMIVVTHYQRLLDYIEPDHLHVLAGGRIVRSGGKELALELEEKGYAPDVIFDEGDRGKEPMIRVFGVDALEVAERVAAIGRVRSEVEADGRGRDRSCW